MNKCYALVWNVSQGCWNVVSEGSRRRGKPAGAKAAIASALALLGATALAPAYALPTGGTVVGGSANGEIHLSGGNSLSVNQKVDKLIANWDSFSVAAGERVIFNQPSSSSIALNRVIGTKASDIQGRIDANGQVFLVNPNGVLFGRGAQVNVGGLVASTLDITDAEFNDNSSRYRFTGPSTNGVLNQGGRHHRGGRRQHRPAGRAGRQPRDGPGADGRCRARCGQRPDAEFRWQQAARHPRRRRGRQCAGKQRRPAQGRRGGES